MLIKIGKIFVGNKAFDDRSMLQRIARSLKQSKNKDSLLIEIDSFIRKCDRLGIPPELIESNNRLIIGLLGLFGAFFNYIPKRVTAFFVRRRATIELAQHRLLIGSAVFFSWYLAFSLIFIIFFHWGLILLLVGASFLEPPKVYLAYLRDQLDYSLMELEKEKMSLRERLLEVEAQGGSRNKNQ